MPLSDTQFIAFSVYLNSNPEFSHHSNIFICPLSDAQSIALSVYLNSNPEFLNLVPRIMLSALF